MLIDLSLYSLQQLEDLSFQVQKEIQQKKSLARKSLIADVERVARDAGASLSELFCNQARGTPVKVRAKVAPKYRNPNNSKQTWSGRGRQPAWLASLLAEGKTLAEILI